MIIDNDPGIFTDAKSFLKGKRVFLDHFLRVNDKKGANNLYVINLITKINFLNTIKQRCLNSRFSKGY
jgi:hypothetical protein